MPKTAYQKRLLVYGFLFAFCTLGSLFVASWLQKNWHFSSDAALTFPLVVVLGCALLLERLTRKDRAG